MPEEAYSISRGFRPRRDLRPVVWMGDALDRLRGCEPDVRAVLGRALHGVQLGYHPEIAKPLHGDLAGTVELRANAVSGTYRLVYAARLTKAVYVLHVFQKKSPRGRALARKDSHLIRSRLAGARQHHESFTPPAMSAAVSDTSRSSTPAR